jgi:hypothetical protein
VQRVRRDGWHLLPLPRTTENLSEDLLCFSRRLGDPVPGRRRATVEVLSPLAPEAARPRSLSALHGSNTFPLHTDGAHRLFATSIYFTGLSMSGNEKRAHGSRPLRAYSDSEPGKEWL